MALIPIPFLPKSQGGRVCAPPRPSEAERHSPCPVLRGRPPATRRTATHDLIAVRDAWHACAHPGDNRPHTSTRLHDDCPTWLDLTHRTLDAVVFAAYGWHAAPEHPHEGGPTDMTDDRILARHLTLNAARASVSGANGATAGPTASTRRRAGGDDGGEHGSIGRASAQSNGAPERLTNE